MPLLIRPETPETDADAIHELTQRAFQPMAFSDGTEPQIIRQLRQNGDLILSLVAEEGDSLIGHVAFSPLRIGNAQSWVALGPIAVEPKRQKQGIGKALVTEGLTRLKAKGANGVALIGNPAVYGSMGFQSHPGLTWRDLPTNLVQYVAFQGPAPSGELEFASAFDLETR